MYFFLRQIYDRTQWDDLGGLLGDMSTLQDGSAADAAVETDWARAVDYALAGGKASPMRLVR